MLHVYNFLKFFYVQFPYVMHKIITQCTHNDTVLYISNTYTVSVLQDVAWYIDRGDGPARRLI